jgi:hypothetical protein
MRGRVEQLNGKKEGKQIEMNAMELEITPSRILQGRGMTRRQSALATASILLAIAATLFLIGRWPSPAADISVPSAGLGEDWKSKAVQIEQLWSDGTWYPREPLPLAHGFAIQGHTVGRPDFVVKLEPMYRTAGDPKSFYLARSIAARCPDGSGEISTVLHNAPTAFWEARLECQSSAWRLRVADTQTVRRPPHAKPGESLPSR